MSTQPSPITSSQINISKPPLSMNMAEDPFAWRKWIDSLFVVLGPSNNTRGSWTPKFENLTVTGTPTYEGNYYRFGFFMLFEMTLKGATFTSAAGSTACNNLPLKALFGGSLIANDSTAKTSLGTGFIESGTTNAYLPTWAASSNEISISGMYLIDV